MRGGFGDVQLRSVASNKQAEDERPGGCEPRDSRRDIVQHLAEGFWRVHGVLFLYE